MFTSKVPCASACVMRAARAVGQSYRLITHPFLARRYQSSTTISSSMPPPADVPKQENFAGRLSPALESELTKLREQGHRELYSTRSYSDARETWARVLELEERYYGDDNPAVADTLVHLSNSCAAVYDLPTQKECLQRAMILFEAHLPPEHPKLALVFTNLGNCVGAMGDVEAQRSLLQRALVIKERAYGAEHPDVAVTLASLGTTFGELGELDKQKEYLQRALQICDRQLENKKDGTVEDHVQAGITELYLAKACLQLSDAAAARRHATHAGSTLAGCLGENNPYQENVNIILEQCKQAL